MMFWNFGFLVCILLLQAHKTQGGYQWTAWSRASSCSRSCGHGVVSRTRECKPSDEKGKGSDDGSYCKGPATIEQPCYLSKCSTEAPASSHCNCGCKLSSPIGEITSVHLQTSHILCNWYIETHTGSSITLKINKIENFDWTKGGIYVAGKNKVHKFTNPYGGTVQYPFPIVIKSMGNQLNITIVHEGRSFDQGIFTILSASYTTDTTASEDPIKHDNDSNGGIEQNLPAIAGIVACGLIIIIASMILVCRKVRKSKDENTGENDEGETPEEGFEDNCSSVSGSQRSTSSKQKHPTNMELLPSHVYPISPSFSGVEERARLIQIPQTNGTLSSRSGYPDSGSDIFVPAVQSGGPYVAARYPNWPSVQTTAGQNNLQPLQIQQLPKAALDFMINQAQMNFVQQMSLENKNAASSSYCPTSEGEG